MKQWLIDLLFKIRNVFARFEVLPKHQNIKDYLQGNSKFSNLSYCLIRETKQTAGVAGTFGEHQYRFDTLKLNETLTSLSMAEVVLPDSTDSEMIHHVGKMFFGNISPTVVTVKFIKEHDLVTHLICDKATDTIISASRIKLTGE